MRPEMWMTSCLEALRILEFEKKKESWDLGLDKASWFSELAEVRPVGSTKCATCGGVKWKSQHSKKLCLSLLMSKNLKLKKVIKSLIPEPIACFSDSYMHMNIMNIICVWTLRMLYVYVHYERCMYMYISCTHIWLGEFPSRFFKCYFHVCIHCSWLAAFSLALKVLFFFSHFIYCLPGYLWLSIFYWLSSFIDLTLNVFLLFFLVCVTSLCALLSFCVWTFEGFLLLHKDIIFMSFDFFLISSDFHRTLHLALGLIGMHFAAAYM